MSLKLPLFAWLLLSVAVSAQASDCRDSIVATAPDSRYQDNGDGTVTDLFTGLVWKQSIEGFTIDCLSLTGTTFSWQGALECAEGRTFAGSSAWRLPNKNELASLVERCRSEPAINPVFFPNTPSGLFWSSSPYAGDPNVAWFVDFFYGYAYYDQKESRMNVRLVRDAQAAPAVVDPEWKVIEEGIKFVAGFDLLEDPFGQDSGYLFSTSNQQLILSELHRLFVHSDLARKTLLNYFSDGRQLRIAGTTEGSRRPVRDARPIETSNLILIDLDDTAGKFLSLSGRVVTLSLGTIVYHEFLHVVDLFKTLVPVVENLEYYDDGFYTTEEFDFLGHVVSRVNKVREELRVNQAHPDTDENFELSRGSYGPGLGGAANHVSTLQWFTEGDYDQAILFLSRTALPDPEEFTSEGTIVDGKPSRDLVVVGNENVLEVAIGTNTRVSTGDGDDVIAGYVGKDHIFAGDGTDRILGYAGDDYIDGGPDGPDVAEYRHERSKYKISRSSEGCVVVEQVVKPTTGVGENDGKDTLVNVETARFRSVAGVETVDLTTLPIETGVTCTSGP